MKNKSSMSLVELLVALCIIFILAGVFAVYGKMAVGVVRKQALSSELNNIRMSIKHYRIIKGQLPKDLVSLTEQDFTFNGKDDIIMRKSFLRFSRVDKEKKLLDPFLNRYYYNARSGRIKSQTKGYETW